MANSVTPDIPPSTYFSPQTVHLQFAPTVGLVSYTVNGIQPTLSEYIAYDTLTPPNPFIAVTQDGKGRVVYDGGFPKFYNAGAPAAGTPFAGLSASFKYLYNAVNWTANPTKVAAGNKKVLILGDVNESSGSPFAVKSTGGFGFYTSLINLFSAPGFGFVPTIKDLLDYPGGYLNPTLAELDQYACLIVFGSGSGGDPKITNAAVQDIQTYRSQGNGVILITDDGPDFTDISQAYPPPNVERQFFVTVNKIAVNFGAYFTGLYDRTPVNVGFLRSTYGDHPLYNGMSNDEDIHAGGSESKVVVATYPTYTEATMPPIPMTADGRYTIRILARMTDGSVETYSYIFAIINGGIVEIRNAGGTALTQIDTGFSDKAPIYPTILGAGLGTISGQVLIGGVKAGDINYTEAGGSTVTWLNGGPFPHVNDGDTIRAEVTSPFSYYVEIPATRFQPDISQMTSQARIQEVLRAFFSAPNIKTPIHQALDASGSTFKSDFGRGLAGLRVYLART